MAIILPNGLTTQEIRVLQEFRRLNSDTLTAEQVKAIKHPTGGGEAPAVSLVAKGLLSGDAAGFSVTPSGKDFLAIDAKPMFEEAGGAGAAADSDADAV
jgi:hypothetical protein